MTITEFLEARIAEDEAKASALLKDLEGQVQEEYAGVVDERGPMTPERLLSAQMWAHYDGQSKRRSFAKGQQIATLASPARVLAECAAKRAMIEICSRQEDRAAELGYWDLDPTEIPRAIAAVYADHPDYDPEWKL